jgi:hypothetical protein
VGNEDGTAVRMLGRLGVSPEALEERLFELRGRAEGWLPAFAAKEGGRVGGGAEDESACFVRRDRRVRSSSPRASLGESLAPLLP